MYDIAEATELIASAGGILLGAVGGSLYFVEKGAKGKLEEELQQAQAALKAKDDVIQDLEQQLEAAQKVRCPGGVACAIAVALVTCAKGTCMASCGNGSAHEQP
jgi:hypothetical protein